MQVWKFHTDVFVVGLCFVLFSSLFHTFFFAFFFFLQREHVIPQQFFIFSEIPAFSVLALEIPLALQSNKDCLLNFEVPSHSLSHSHKPASALLSVSFTMFAKSHLSFSLSLSLSDSDAKTYDHLYKHRHPMFPMSEWLWGNICFLWHMQVHPYACRCLSLCADIMLFDSNAHEVCTCVLRL